MSDDTYQIETRRRSRSKTPFLRSGRDHENLEQVNEDGHVHQKKKKSSVAPNVQTIIEEHVTKTTSSSSSSSADKIRGKASATARQHLTSDYSSDDTTPEDKRRQQQQQTKTTTVTSIITQTSKRLGNAFGSFSSASTSTPRNNSQIETTQNVLNSAQEQRSSSKRISRSNGGNVGNSELLPYHEYKEAGEYWNKTPKTDYTYSELSPDRRLLAPGIVAMPNMSRRGLENHNARVNLMVQQNPAQEEFIRRRYQSKYTQRQSHLNYDSADEVDITNFGANQQKQSWWFFRLITTVVTTITTVWARIANVGGSSETDIYHTYYGTKAQQAGILGKISSGLLSILRYLYLFIASVLSLDTWLLKSSKPENKAKKRFLLLLLILLPLLLLTAWSLLQDEQRALYAQRLEAWLPLTLYASLHNRLTNAGASFKSLVQLPSLNWGAEVNEAEALKLQMLNIEQNMQKSLTPEEYENILNHVHSYVQQLVELKLQQQEQRQGELRQQLSPQQLKIIVNLMRENLAEFAVKTKSQLSDADVEALAIRLKLQLQQSGEWQGRPVSLTAAQLDEIRQLLVVELKQHEHYTWLVERIDLDALLGRILAAPQMAEFVDARIHLALARHTSEQPTAGSGHSAQSELLVDELNKEIAFIKLALSDKHAENADLQQSLSKLKLSQEDLLERMQRHELAQDKRFSGVLAEIETKLAALNDSQFATLNKQMKLTLVEILGFKQTADNGGEKLDDIDLQNWVRSMFVAKDYLEQQLLELNRRTHNNIREEIERSSAVLMSDISERLKREILLAVEAKHTERSTQLKTQIREEEVHKIVKAVLAIYDADKTGLVDFALESAGGQILSTRCTESYQTKSAQISVFGIPLWYPSNTPRVAISPNVHPGECWAFQGFPGFLVLKLNSMVYITGFTLEHIPKSLSPTGRIDSAPRNFTVWGLEHEKDQEPVFFGAYEYVDNEASLQYFPVQNPDIKQPYEIVELRIESNHGQPTYTCLYRFRVHGKPPGA